MSAARRGPRAMERRFSRWLGPALALGAEGPGVLRALLGLVGTRAEVRFEAAAPSAHIGWDASEGRFGVVVGARLLAAMRGPADLLYVIAHELVHLVRGDLMRPPGVDPIAYNLAADALNDAWLTGPALEGFFSPLHAMPARRSVEAPDIALLVPLEAAARHVGLRVEGAPPETSRLLFERLVRPPSPPGLVPWSPAAWAAAHRALQLGGRDDSLGLDVAVQLVQPLLDQLRREDEAAARVSLPAAALEALAELRRAVGPLGASAGEAAGGGGAGPAGPPRMVPAVPAGRALRRLERFLRGLVDVRCEAALSWSSRGVEARPSDRGRNAARRALVEFRAGLRASPWAEEVARGGEGPFGLHVYLDVSASMWRELPPILATLAAACADVLVLPVVAFSVAARPVTLRELSRGRLPSDGGTDFGALAEDMLARQVQRAVVITDGEAAPLPAAQVRALRGRGVRVAIVFPGAIAASPLDAVCPRGWKLGLGLDGMGGMR